MQANGITNAERKRMRLGIRKSGRLPNVIIIGAMKAGTSSLHFYLNQHPQIRMSRHKELRFFIEEGTWSRGLNWYRTQFSSEVPFAGESTPGYTHFPTRRGVAERMREVLPEVKLIYVVRDPIERTLSHYVHEVGAGREGRPLDQAVTSAKEVYVTRSSYYMQISQYLQFFPAAQIHIVNSADLFHNRRETLRGVFRFLGADETFNSPKFDRIRGGSQDKRQPTPPGARVLRFIDTSFSWLPSATRGLIKRPIVFPFSRPMPKPVLSNSAEESLRQLLRDDIEQFRQWTDNPLTGWSV